MQHCPVTNGVCEEVKNETPVLYLGKSFKCISRIKRSQTFEILGLAL